MRPGGFALQRFLSTFAPSTYSKLRDVVHRNRQWFAESPSAGKLAAVAPSLMLGRNLVGDISRASDSESSSRINALKDLLPVCSDYLEIGVSYGVTFEAVDIPFKWGVDPQPKFNTHLLPSGCRFSRLTSDAFFASVDPRVRFDLIFLDGLHQWHQTYRDLVNSLAHAHAWTIFLIDDVVPIDEFASWPDMDKALAARFKSGDTNTAWQGDVYKLMFAIRDHHPELDFRVITDGENAQAVVWRKNGVSAASSPILAKPDEYSNINYSVVFDNDSPPSWFNGKPLAEVLADVRQINEAR